MSNILRRTFIKSIIFTPLIISCFTPKSYASSQLIDKNTFITPSLEIEMLKAYSSWTRKFNEKPVEFLNRLDQKTISDVSASSRSIEEFHNGDVFYFNGLLLGKTEAAIILNSYFS